MLNAWTTANLATFGTYILIVGFACYSASQASATVFEYDDEGKVSVTETRRSSPSKVTPSRTDQTASFRALSRQIALQYAGDAGLRKAGLDALTFVDIFEALIKNESAFDPNAVSKKGAMGLGQLMPDTAADLKVSDPFNPRQNLVGSVNYLVRQLDSFGSLELALAAYNAGPERVRKYGGVPPFPETQAYISNIFAAAGLTAQPAARTQPTPVSVPINKEQPLKGDVSVWEY